jgi:guanylate kinase
MSGKLLIISGPSGSGKTTIAKHILNIFKEKVFLMPTYTTRPIRNHEVDGIDYNFISVDRFKELSSGGFFLEKIEYSGNCYGTAKSCIDDLNCGKNIIFVINRAGAVEWKKKYKNIISFWIDSEDLDLKKRLFLRGDCSSVQVERRMKECFLERESDLIDRIFDYYIDNKDLYLTYICIENILHSIL